MFLSKSLTRFAFPVALGLSSAGANLQELNQKTQPDHFNQTGPHTVVLATTPNTSKIESSGLDQPDHPVSFKPKKVEEVFYLGQEGGILTSFLRKLGYSLVEIYNDIIPALEDHIDPSRLSDRQEIEIVRTADGNIKSIAFPDMDNPLKKTVLNTQTFEVREVEVPYEKQTRLIHTDIESSFYASMHQSGASSPLISEMIRLYSWDVNWQRDIRRGDEATVYFTEPVLQNGKRLERLPEVEYAKLKVQGNPIEIFLFEGEYYKSDGTSIRRTLLRTPVDGARLSSSFNPNRLHPVYRTRMPHNGTDFAAPTGTAIYAAGDGDIIFAGREPYDGNLIRIRHGETDRGVVITSYSHLNGFARGVRTGKRVSQGDIIGFIGMTGTATGPHLHYAIKVNGRFVNPMTLELPKGEPLKGDRLKAFEREKKAIQRQVNQMTLSH